MKNVSLVTIICFANMAITKILLKKISIPIIGYISLILWTKTYREFKKIHSLEEQTFTFEFS